MTKTEGERHRERGERGKRIKRERERGGGGLLYQGPDRFQTNFIIKFIIISVNRALSCLKSRLSQGHLYNEFWNLGT